MFRPKQLPGPFDCQCLNLVYMFTSAIIASSRISFRVLIGRHCSHRKHDRRTYNILRRNQLQISPLTCQLRFQSLSHFRIILTDIIHDFLYQIHYTSSFLFCCTAQTSISDAVSIVIEGDAIFHKDSLHKSFSCFQLHSFSLIGIIGQFCENMPFIV